MGDVIEWNDRYGGKYPDPETICLGPCDGMGCFPVSKNENGKYAALWEEAEKKKPTKNGWHFVKCPECNGTGKRS